MTKRKSGYRYKVTNRPAPQPWDEPRFQNRKYWNGDPIAPKNAFFMFPVLDVAPTPFTGELTDGCIKLSLQRIAFVVSGVVPGVDPDTYFGTVEQGSTVGDEQDIWERQEIFFERKNIFRLIGPDELHRWRAHHGSKH